MSSAEEEGGGGEALGVICLVCLVRLGLQYACMCTRTHMYTLSYTSALRGVNIYMHAHTPKGDIDENDNTLKTLHGL